MALVWLDSEVDEGSLASELRVELLGEWPERAARRVRAELLNAQREDQRQGGSNP